MSCIAKVVVDISAGKEFDYRIPPELEHSVSIGIRVNIPFGASFRTGYVVNLVDRSDRAELKSIIGVADAKPFFKEPLLKLARWMAEYYCAPIEQAVRAILPGAVRKKGAKFRERLFVQPLAIALENTPVFEGLTDKQKLSLDHIVKVGQSSLEDVCAFCNVTSSVVKSLEKKGYVSIVKSQSLREVASARNVIRSEPLVLSSEQKTALDLISAAADKQSAHKSPDAAADNLSANSRHVVLLHGVTGSGKTEVYLQAIARMLEAKRGAIVLVPEIALTPQTVERFAARFGDRIAVLHSHLSDGERHDEWHRICDGRADVVIGARSAVFAPVANLGMIIVDEEHEHTYKQDEAPRYNARDVAVMRGKLEGCAVVLGSATPCIESWNNALTGKFILAELPKRVDDRKMPHMRIVDMRIGAKDGKKSGIFSQDLIESIGDRLERKEQVMLFLNRRGHSTSIVCPACGFTEKCADCSVTLTYHRTDEKLLCHVCGKVTKVPEKCNKCSAEAVKYSGVGTQKVEEVTKKIFPKANIARLDSDTTTKKDSYEDVLGRFRTGKIDILIGTQMIAKGLHFPNVTLVGVVYADMSLNIPDFRASERTFQLIAQVAGRAGRGDVSGEVIVQTFTPFHQAVQAARRLDYKGFCDQELEYRKELLYPPFAHLFVLTFKGRFQDRTAALAGFYSKRLSTALEGKALVSEAVEAPLAKMKGQYRHQVIIRAKSAKAVRDGFRTLTASIKPSREISCVIDVDALNIM